MASFDKGFALVVGIANYPKVASLSELVLNDARDISTLLTDSTQCGYLPNQVKLLLDEQATLKNIRESLGWLANYSPEDSTVLIFFSGHGGRIETSPQAENYLIPFDTNPQDLKNTALESAELTRLLGKIRAKRLLVLFDCCHAGGLGEIKDALDKSLPGFKSGLDERYYEQLAMGQGRVIISSSRSIELSWILPGMRNSLFTHYLLQALQGQAPTYGDGLIRIFDIFNFVAEAVPKHHPQQHPLLKAQVETNFPVALYLRGKASHDNQLSEPTLENPRNLLLPAEIKLVLKTMFADYQRVMIEREFGGGFSGGASSSFTQFVAIIFVNYRPSSNWPQSVLFNKNGKLIKLGFATGYRTVLGCETNLYYHPIAIGVAYAIRWLAAANSPLRACTTITGKRVWPIFVLPWKNGYFQLLTS
jgi:hypothetical protein